MASSKQAATLAGRIEQSLQRLQVSRSRNNGCQWDVLIDDMPQAGPRLFGAQCRATSLVLNACVADDKIQRQMQYLPETLTLVLLEPRREEVCLQELHLQYLS